MSKYVDDSQVKYNTWLFRSDALLFRYGVVQRLSYIDRSVFEYLSVLLHFIGLYHYASTRFIFFVAIIMDNFSDNAGFMPYKKKSHTYTTEHTR